MQTLSKRDQQLLKVVFVGAVALVLVLIWNYLFLPAKAGAQAKLLSLAEARHKTDVQKRAYNRLAQDARELGPRIAKQAYDAPVEELIPLVIRDLQTIAGASGVHLREIKPLRVRSVAAGSLTRVPLEARFRAPFQPNVMRLLYRLEDPKGKIVVDRLNIASGEARFKTVDVAVQISVFTRAATSETGASEGETSDTSTRTNAAQ